MGRIGSAWSARHAASIPLAPGADDRWSLRRLLGMKGLASSGLLVAGLLLLGAGVRALRFGGRFRYLYHWDETGIAIPALQILDGDLPVHFLGTAYMGNTASYPLAVWFALVGSAPLALDLFAYAVGLAMLVTGWLLATRLLPGPASRWVLAVLAVPPVFETARSLDGSLAYQALLVLGNLFLVGTHRLFFRGLAGPAAARALLGLGVLAGVGLWQNQLFVVYLVPFAVLAVRVRLVGQPRAGLFAAGVLLGALPAWLHEIRDFPSARLLVHEVGAGPATTVGERAWQVVVTHVPTLLGLQREEGTPLAGAGIVTLAGVALGLGALVRAALRDGGELRWTLGLGGRAAGGASLLWWVLLANVGLVLVTQRGGTAGGRYVFPLLSVAPLWIGETLFWLAQRRRTLGATALTALLVFQLWANWADTLGGTPPTERRWRQLEVELGPLVDWLGERGIRRVYWGDAPGVQSYQLTYWMEQRLVAADLWREPALPYARLVDAARSPAFVVADEPTALVAGLRGLGLDLRQSQVGRFHVIEPVPALGTGFQPIAPDRWALTASDMPELAANLADRDVSTGWHSGGAQVPGQWLAVDLGGEETVARVDLLAVDWQDVPAGFRVEVSGDGAAWQPVVDVPRYWGPLFVSEAHPFLKIRRGRVQAIFAPVRARRVRFVQTGTVSYRSWAARELFVYRPAAPAPSPPEPETLATAVAREGIEFLYANHYLSAVVETGSAGRIRAQTSNLFLNSYGGDRPRPELPQRFVAGSGRGVLVGSDADRVETRALLEAQGLRLRETTAGPYPLLVLAGPPARPRPVSRGGWRIPAGDHAASAERVVDGQPGTAWTAASPTVAFTLDLGVPRRVGRVALRPGLAGTGARGLAVAASLDGQTWQPVDPVRWAGPLHWTGSELLALGGDAGEWTFPPVELRYLRLSLRAPAPGEPWTIDAIDLFE
jgi:F5/8 type C domain-containing protein